jgi:hypothetical protein
MSLLVLSTAIMSNREIKRIIIQTNLIVSPIFLTFAFHKYKVGLITLYRKNMLLCLYHLIDFYFLVIMLLHEIFI